MYIYDTNKVGIRTDDYYAENSVQVLSDSTADTELGLDNNVNSGTTGTVAAGVVDLGTIEPSFDTWSEVGSGTYDESGYPPTVYEIGTITDAWELEFTSAVAFTLTGTLTGLIGAGDTSTDFQVANLSSYYFTILAAGWGGVWTLGDKITFNTVNSAKGAWIKETIPAATVAYASSTTKVAIDGEY